MHLYPNAEVSYQLVTENDHLQDFGRKLKRAKRINAAVYDLQMTFYSKKYLKLIHKVVDKIKQYEL